MVAALTAASLLLLSLSAVGVEALSCEVCDKSSCPSVAELACSGDDVLADVCGCCRVCARRMNESCGGFHGLLGKCADSLKCFIAPPPLGEPITGHEEGVCRELFLFTCNNTDSDCRDADIQLCPPDSELVFNATSDLPSYCRCNASRCGVPECATGFAASFVQKGAGTPGNCCDEHICARSSVCQLVTCPAVSEDDCPPDSQRPPSIWTEDGCCQLRQGCVCQSEETCPPVECPDGFQTQVVSRATRTPGSCCDKFKCVNETGLTCSYEERQFQNGDSWQIEKCTTCTCNDGISRCRVSSCSPPPCGWMVIPEGECCPVCRGCVSDSGGLYNNSDHWRENDCVTCHCQDGQVLCQAEMCAVGCSHPRPVPGQCCPVCDEPDNPVVTPRLCPSMENCSLDCPLGLDRDENECAVCKCKPKPCDLVCEFGRAVDEQGTEVCQCNALPPRCSPLEECDKKCVYGYKIGRAGCQKCRCNKCPAFSCTKRCLHGYLVNEDGCQLCKCADPPPLLPPPITPIPSNASTQGRSCLTSLGVRREDGEAWDDGCRLCFCRNGREMCSLIACPAPRCENPIFRIGDCCPSCPGVSFVPPGGERELCQSASGEYHVEGETWALDACTRCLCHAGTVLCETPVCPPVLCHHPVKPTGSCCAICKGEEESNLSIAGLTERPCKSATGVLWQHGHVWWAGPCQSCQCQSGQVTCYSQVCPPLNCNKTVLRKGQCCPTCVDGSRPHVCVSDGVTYSEAEAFVAENCTECVCRGGYVICLPLSCPHLPCTMMIRKKDQCCPVCYDESLLNTFPTVIITGGTADTETTATETHTPVENLSKQDNYMVGMVVLGVLLFVVLVVVIVLVLIILRRRHTGKFKMAGRLADSPMMTEIKIRPKSTNLELQGHMPFLDSPTKPVNLERNCLEKSALLLPILAPDSLKITEQLSNHFSDGISDGKETIANGHFISNNKSFEQV